MAVGEDCFGVLASLAKVLELAECDVAAELRAFYVERIQGQWISPGEAHVLLFERLVEFSGEVVAEGDEGVEDAVVSCDPGGDYGCAEDGRECCSGQVWGEA